MFYPSKEEFVRLSKQGNLIPVYKELVADMETPVSAFKKIEGDEYAFLFESVEGGENIARYSFLGLNPSKVFKFTGDTDSFAEVKKIITLYKPVKIQGLPRFHGGLVGHINYDAIRHIENIPDKNPDDLKVPEMEFMLTDTILAFDHVKHKILMISNAHIKGDPEKAYDEAREKILALEKKLKKPTPTVPSGHLPLIKGENERGLKTISNFTKEEYEKVVEKAKEYVRAGDIIQVVPSQRFETEFKGDPFDVYRILRILNPSPYMFYLKFGKVTLAGSSPEVMVRLEDREAVVRPIAGTRPRGINEKEDKRLAEELLADEKERAEHIMLVDLARNDLGRVCDKDSIKVTDLMSIEKYSHVMHIVSNVEGTLRKDKDAFDLIRASFPAGTVSGAPKVRAMEIIDELENKKRGPYAGAIGYFSFTGEMDMCIAIRTILMQNGKAYVQAGGGVVADSILEKEYEETMNKARAMLKTLELLQ
ncbi:anthranilate synthase component I [Candidatus Saganbacteria bacterium]|nr:anthranilate synthase component I [Candidatus Saganbacteria bacterium]